MKRPHKSPAPKLIPLPGASRYPLYRIKIPPNFKDLLVGATLGNRYWVLSVIGKGGMSVVYKAKARDTGRIVAVKTLRTQGLTDEMLVKRFQREAELLSRLNHPRIVNLHAYGTSNRGQPYFVMDFLQGQNLTEVLKQERQLAPERFQDIFVQVCAAIEHAHKHNAIHRDIKPGNIMLTRQGRTSDYVKIVDFGIAMITEEAQRLTRMGEVWGSPIYMSPEQCMGANVDLRSDIYSLGVVMYESLTGKVPFLGRNYADTMSKQISEPPTPMKEVRPDLDIPASMEKIVMKALAKMPEDRYQSLTQMRKDLEAALSYTPPTGKAEKPGNKHKPEPKRQEVRQTERDFDLEANQVGRRSGSKTNVKTLSPKDRASNLKNPRSSGTRRISDLKDKKKKNLPAGRTRNLILVVLGSLLVSSCIIFAASNVNTLTTVLGELARSLLKGATDDGAPFQNQDASGGKDGTEEPKLAP